MTDCPTPSRLAFPTEGLAWGAVRHHPGHAMAPYRCGGHWHITTTAEARAKREAGRP